MYIQLTIELIAKAIELFCTKRGVEMNAKDAKKIYSSLAGDDDLVKHYFCEAKCKSKNICMKEVGDEGMLCHVHDPNHKCQGKTIKGERCGNVAKVGEDYCWRHHAGDVQKKRTAPGAFARPQTKVDVMKFPLHPDCIPEESIEDEVPTMKRSSKKKHAKK
ncbi:hypothetical protein BGZ81_004656, partial [Podila clonocystis]